MISKKKINKIINSISIKDVISEYISLDKVGENYRGFSPFNVEKHPSFMVSEKKKIWKDFSSGKFGNVITFIMYMRNYNFLKSVYYLNDKYHLNLFNNKNHYYNNYKKYCFFFKKKKCIIKKLRDINFISNYYLIKNLNKNKIKLNYLINIRKIPIKLIKKFKIGYCDDNINLFNILNNTYKKKLLLINGFFIKKKKKIINILNNSITFPIHNIKGYILGYGAKKSFGKIKYLNSYTNYNFKKNNILYGLYFSNKYIIKYNYCILTEGYIDLLSLYKINIKNVVSTLGTNLSQNQINILKKITKNIIIIYDGDKAGILATKKIIKILLKNSFNIRIFLLKKKYDIDNYILNKNKNNYKNKFIKKKILKNCVNILSFFKKIYNYNKIKNKRKKSLIIIKILKYINIMDNYIYKYLYLKKMSKIFNINRNILILQFISLNKNNFLNKSLDIKNNIYIDIINYKYNYIKNFYKNNNNIKKKIIKKKNKNYIYKKFYIEKYIINILIIYNIQYYIFNRYKKIYYYIISFLKKKKITFLNKKYSYIYKNIITNNNISFLKKKIIDLYIKKYSNYKAIKKKNIKIFCNIIYLKYKIFKINLKIKKIIILNNNSIKKIILLIKKKIKYKNKINFFYNL
ncbi:MAG: CHC2 zinc finger domain-containing protein [Candidatus Shikimatogenerans sp. Tcar]|uniref:CHC2 zinc finger domain-containing protein n=1 Tax=Candidatus Shikimatogenerans sp. Tcar TaxID=3158565 RepID=A0AAU7QSG8_9FLAO